MDLNTNADHRPTKSVGGMYKLLNVLKFDNMCICCSESAEPDIPEIHNPLRESLKWISSKYSFFDFLTEPNLT